MNDNDNGKYSERMFSKGLHKVAVQQLRDGSAKSATRAK